jgi:hypothetical protein
VSAFLGITREPVFSPGKVDADRAILLAVAEALERRGHAVRVAAGEDALPEPDAGEAVFAMCQGDAALATLRAWEGRGVRVVNSVASVLGCHRHRLLESLRRAAVKAPDALVFDTARDPARWPTWLEPAGGWLKRGDVHATEANDVVFVRDAGEAHSTVARFRARGIERAALQRHVDGTTVKFYAAGDRLIAWFPPSGVELRLSAIEVDALAEVARSAAEAVGLDLYGGDCVVDAEGGVALIDLNDWPSYAACRAAAAEAIAAHLEKRCALTRHR